MAGLCDGSLFFFVTERRAQVIAMHRVQGGLAVFLDGTRVILAEGDQEGALMDIQAIPLTEGGTLDAQNRNVLAAVAGAWALNVHEDLIRAGIETFGLETSESFTEAAASHVEARSEEHTSELQSLMSNSYAVFCLKKKTSNKSIQSIQ